MIPLPVDPKVVVLIENGMLVAVASNIDPELTVNVVTTKEAYGEAIKGVPFDSAQPNPQIQVLAAKH